jgi:protein-S-isoprenylcysteine O-methyltransferase Ste14
VGQGSVDVWQNMVVSDTNGRRSQCQLAWLWLRAATYMLVVGGIHYVAVPMLLTAGGVPMGFRRGRRAVFGVGLIASGAMLALAAANALVTRGNGTPFPLDPTRDLVTDGPYGYVRNPQALAATLIVSGEVLLVKSRRLWLLLPLTLLYLEGLAAPVERKEMFARFGRPYLAYRRRVPAWFPRMFDGDGRDHRIGFAVP